MNPGDMGTFQDPLLFGSLMGSHMPLSMGPADQMPNMQQQQQHQHQQQQQQQPPINSGASQPNSAQQGGPAQPPPSNNLKKKRIPACDLCNSKKIKCDGNQNCSNCLKSGNPCTFERNKDPNKQPTKRPRKDGPASAAMPGMGGMPSMMGGAGFPNTMGVTQNTSLLGATIPPSLMMPRTSSSGFDPLVSGIVPPRIDPPIPPSAPRISSNIGGNIPNFPTPPSLNASIPAGMNQIVTAGMYNSGSNAGLMLSGGSSSMAIPPGAGSSSLSSREDPLTSIPQDAHDELVELYFEYIDPTVPIIQQSTFMENRANESPLLLCTMYALAARYSTHQSVMALGSIYGGPASTMDEVKQRACDVFYFRARDLVDQYMDFAKASTIAAFLLLKLLCAASGRISASWMYSGMAISMLKEMRRGANTDDDAPPTEADTSIDWLEREKRRRLWWACYIGDRYAAAASDRPMIVQDADCKVHFPATVEDWLNGYPASPETPEVQEDRKRQIAEFASQIPFNPIAQNQSYLDYFILLSKIFGRVIDFTKVYKTTGGLTDMLLNSVTNPMRNANNSNTEAQNETQLIALQTALESWYNYLPDSYRQLNYDVQLIAACSRPNPSSAKREVYLRANLAIYYRMCLILLHKPKLMNLLRKTTLSRHHATIPKADTFIACHTAAKEITQIIEAIRGRDASPTNGSNPSLTHFTPFVTSFAVFQSALVHLIAGQVCCGGADGVRSAQVHSNALKGLARDWGLAGKLYSSLISLIDVAREAAMNGEMIQCGDHCTDPENNANIGGMSGAGLNSPMGGIAGLFGLMNGGMNGMSGFPGGMAGGMGSGSGLGGGMGGMGGMGGGMGGGFGGLFGGGRHRNNNAPGQARIEELSDDVAATISASVSNVPDVPVVNNGSSSSSAGTGNPGRGSGSNTGKAAKTTSTSGSNKATNSNSPMGNPTTTPNATASNLNNMNPNLPAASGNNMNFSSNMPLSNNIPGPGMNMPGNNLNSGMGSTLPPNGLNSGMANSNLPGNMRNVNNMPGNMNGGNINFPPSQMNNQMGSNQMGSSNLNPMGINPMGGNQMGGNPMGMNPMSTVNPMGGSQSNKPYGGNQMSGNNQIGGNNQMGGNQFNQYGSTNLGNATGPNYQMGGSSNPMGGPSGMPGFPNNNMNPMGQNPMGGNRPAGNQMPNNQFNQMGGPNQMGQMGGVPNQMGGNPMGMGGGNQMPGNQYGNQMGGPNAMGVNQMGGPMPGNQMGGPAQMGNNQMGGRPGNMPGGMVNGIPMGSGMPGNNMPGNPMSNPQMPQMGNMMPGVNQGMGRNPIVGGNQMGGPMPGNPMGSNMGGSNNQLGGPNQMGGNRMAGGMHQMGGNQMGGPNQMGMGSSLPGMTGMQGVGGMNQGMPGMQAPPGMQGPGMNGMWPNMNNNNPPNQGPNGPNSNNQGGNDNPMWNLLGQTTNFGGLNSPGDFL